MSDIKTFAAKTDIGTVKRVPLGEWVMVTAFTVLAVVVYQQILGPLTEQGYASGDPVNNAALFPRLVANFILGLCVLQLIQILRRRVQLSAEFLHKATRENIWRCLVSAVVIPAYLLLMPRLGFYPATVLFLLTLFLVLKARPIWFTALVAALLTLTVGYLFEELLRVVLPRGHFNFSL